MVATAILNSNRMVMNRAIASRNTIRAVWALSEIC